MTTPHESSNYQNHDKTWEALLRISEEAHSTKNIQEFVATIHGILSELTNARNFFIALYDAHADKYFFPYFTDEFDTIETTGINSTYDASLDVTLYDASGTLTDYVRRTGMPSRFPNKHLSELYKSGEITLFGSQSISWLGVPLKLSEEPIGVMVVQSYDIKDAYSAKDEELLVFASDHITRAIESVREEEKMRKQHLLVLEQSKAITDSISYARRIQKAVLPSPAYLENILADYFTIYKPKDIVSGDFYWVREIKGSIVVIVADSSGHGVPGALMSMLGITLLNEQFRTFGIRQPAEILGHLRTKVKEILFQEGSVNDQKDGMDMSIAIINREKTEIQFAGANLCLYLCRKNEDYELTAIKGDKQPIGIHWEEDEFTNHRIKIQKKDSFYLFSDGYVDQYGGEKRKKFKTRNFKKLLLSVQAESMENQKKLIEEAFEKWRGSYEQIDDVCVFGVKL